MMAFAFEVEEGSKPLSLASSYACNAAEAIPRCLLLILLISGFKEKVRPWHSFTFPTGNHHPKDHSSSPY